MELDKWQKEVLKTDGNICLRSGRQVGKSTIISIKAGDYAASNKNKKVLIISATERQAYLLYEKVLAYIHDNYKKYLKKGKDRPTKSTIKLNNGSIIYCLPTGLSGLGIRGYTIDMMIADEAAFIPQEVWSALTPMLATTKGNIILLSTPHGKEGYFYNSFSDSAFTSFHVSSEECPRINKEFLEREKQTMTKLQYAQEYLGMFVDELRQFFSDKLIKECMILKRNSKRDFYRDYYLGVDVARMGEDESTFEILDCTEKDKLIHIENIITRKTLLTETAKKIIDLNKEYNFKKIYIDDAGVGSGVFDYLLEYDDTKKKIVAINNRSRPLDKDDEHKKKILKEDLYNNLLGLMERKQIKLLDDDEIFRSLKSVQYEYITTAGALTKFKIFGSYTHIVEGLIRAAWCVKDKSLNIWVRWN